MKKSRYSIWLQARLRNGEKEWAAECNDCPGKWLCSAAWDRADAMRHCEAHEKKYHPK